MAKYRNLTARTLPADSMARIEDTVFNLERAQEVATLSKILRGETKLTA